MAKLFAEHQLDGAGEREQIDLVVSRILTISANLGGLDGI